MHSSVVLCFAFFLTQRIQSSHRRESLLVKHRCPICKAETDSEAHKDFPFCSERCRMQDLGNWASEKYVVSDPIFDEEEVMEGERKTILLDLDKSDDHES